MPMGPPVWEMSPTGVTPILEFFFFLGGGAFWIWEVLFLWGGRSRYLEAQPLGGHFPDLASLPARPGEDSTPVRIHPWMEYVARTPGATFSHWLRELSRGSIDDDHSA